MKVKFLANENIPLSSILSLRAKGFDIKSIGVDHPGISDENVMSLAHSERRTIVTYDRDYGELIYKYGYKPKCGVIFIRHQPTDPNDTSRIIEKFSTAGI